MLSENNARQARTVVLRLKTKEFTSFTRSLTPPAPISSCEELTNIALALRERVDLPRRQLYRLVGVGLSNFTLDEDAAGDATIVDSLEAKSDLFLQAQQ